MTEPIDILDGVVEELNQAAFEHFEKIGADPECCNLFKLVSNGMEQEITFMDISIWDSETDDRDELPDGPEGNLEPVDTYVRRRVKKLLADLSSIQF